MRLQECSFPVIFSFSGGDKEVLVWLLWLQYNVSLPSPMNQELSEENSS